MDSFSGLKEPYHAALEGDWKGMASFYSKHPERLLDPLTIDKDTAFHIAAYSAETKLLRRFLDLLKEPSQILAALSNKNSHGNNTFHEVTIKDNVEAAELLISKLRWACAQDKVQGKNFVTELKKLLEDRNQLGETPLYRAVALGQFQVLKFCAKRIGNLSDHFHRNDSMSILHIAVIGQHFGLSLSLSYFQITKYFTPLHSC
jgi:ankyrin repeat protein